MMKSIFNILIINLVCTFNISAQVTKIFKQERESHIPLIVMQYKMEMDSVTAQKISDSLLKEAKRLGEDKEIWYVELSLDNMINYHKEKQTFNAVHLLSKEKYYLSSAHAEIPIAYYYDLAESYVRLKDVEKAYHYFFIVENLLEKFGYQNMPLTPYIMSSLANFYAQFEDYRFCVKYCKIGMDYKIRTPFSMLNSFGLNNLGFFLLKLKRYDEAEKIFIQVIEASKNDKDNFYEGIGASNIGNIKRIKGKYQDALAYLYKDVLINENQVKENAATTCLYLADCLLHLDSVSKAKTFIEKAKELANQSYYQSSFYPTYYEVSSLYYKKTGNYSFSLKMQDSLIQLKDSLKIKYDANVLRVSTLKEKEVKFLEQENLTKTKAQNTVRIRNIIIACLSLLFLSVIYAFYQKFKKEKLKAIQIEKEAQQAIDMANEKLQNFIGQIQEKNKIIEQLQELNPPDASTEENLAVVQNLIQSVILTDEQWVRFKTLFEQVFPKFFQQLTNQYPSLTAAEIRLLALQKLNLPDKDMGNMLGISADSVRKTRYRLIKKYPELRDKKSNSEDEV
jgi:tetratricopeptide (TPR) repeat protein